MGLFRNIAETLFVWGKENALDLLNCVVIPQTSAAARNLVPTASRWATANAWAEKTVDGAIIGGLRPPRSGAKYAIPKGLPKQGDRALAIENEPHTLDGFNGVIKEGYGKGTKLLLSSEKVGVKIAGKRFLTDMEYHIHDAERAGLHYDLAIANLPPGTKEFELHIPRGEFKGRWAFVTTAKGMVITPMKDRGIVLPKPDYSLKHTEFLDRVKNEPLGWVVEHKMDGSLGNCAIKDFSATFRSHRDSGQTYYDRLPQLEDLANRSKYLTFRSLFPGPQLNGTVLQGELYHPDGAGRMGGILNAMPEKAQAIQKLRGPATYWGWDIVKYKGRDVSHLPYIERRELLDQVITELRQYNKHYNIVERCMPGEDPAAFYERITSLPLPFGEGIVLKRSTDAAGETWFKVKKTDFEDLQVMEILPGTGKYADTVGKMVVRNPDNGAIGEVGSFAITDEMRDWIWDHKELLTGSVAKIQVQEMTSRGAPRAGVFHAFHEGKGSEAGLLMYAESLAGGNQEEMMRTKYALISAAGWRR